VQVVCVNGHFKYRDMNYLAPVLSSFPKLLPYYVTVSFVSCVLETKDWTSRPKYGTLLKPGSPNMPGKPYLIDLMFC
jgi:hypothetical protein